MGADARLLVRRGRKEAETYRLKYHEKIPVYLAAKEIGAIAQDFTQSGCVVSDVSDFFVFVFVVGEYDHLECQCY